MNPDTMTSPGIGLLGPAFAPLGGAIIDVRGLNGFRATAQIAAGRMFKGWVAGYRPSGWPLVPPVPPWKRVADTTFNGPALVGALGGGLSKANLRVTLFDGDSGSPNPVYQTMFGADFNNHALNIPYFFATSQPAGNDFDGGNNLYFGFEDTSGSPVSCGYMGSKTTYRLDASENTIETYTGFPGCFALTDPDFASTPHPPQYMLPVQTGQPAGVWPVTGWFSVPDTALAALYAVLNTGVVRLGIYDVSSGDQYYDFTQGLAGDVVDLPFSPPVSYFGNLDLWVWRELNRFDALDQNLNFPPGYAKALMYALGVEFFPEYPAAAQKYDYREFMAEADAAIADLERLNQSDAVAQEPAV